MLKIIIPEYELFNEQTEEFITVNEQSLILEHSLISISKWESKWHKPFLGPSEKTVEQVNDYIKCMTINSNVSEDIYNHLTREQYSKINEYISNPMTATTINEVKGGKNTEILSAELIYYYMITANIPFECEKWHINRLMTLIKVCQIKSQPEKKRDPREVMRSNAAINAARKKQLNTKG